MAFPKLTKPEALKLECARLVPHDVERARHLYEFITEKPKVVKKPSKKPRAKN